MWGEPEIADDGEEVADDGENSGSGTDVLVEVDEQDYDLLDPLSRRHASGNMDGNEVDLEPEDPALDSDVCPLRCVGSCHLPC